MSIETILAEMSDDDRARFTSAISQIGSAFAARTTVEVDPAAIAGLPQIRDHVLTGGEIELDIAAAIEELKNEPSISNKLIAAEVKAAEFQKIADDTRNMSPADKITYARERGLDRPRSDTASTMTRNEHEAVLAQLSPQQRMNYARKHGLV